jgi:hypothetical protein
MHSLVEKLITKDPAKRPDIKEVLSIVAHLEEEIRKNDKDGNPGAEGEKIIGSPEKKTRGIDLSSCSFT